MEAIDTLNTPMQDQSVVRDQVLKYLNGARHGARIAIFGLNSRLRLLQGFTSDPELIRTVLNGEKAGSQASPLINDSMSGDVPGAADELVNAVADSIGNNLTPLHSRPIYRNSWPSRSRSNCGCAHGTRSKR